MYGKPSIRRSIEGSSVAARWDRQIPPTEEGLPESDAPPSESAKAPGSHAGHVVVRSGGRILFLRAQEIDWVESAGNYVFVHIGIESHRLRETMRGFAARLDPGSFLRIHRSRLVNIERIREVYPWHHGDSVVILRDGTRLPMSRGRRETLLTILRKDK